MIKLLVLLQLHLQCLIIHTVSMLCLISIYTEETSFPIL